jgi:hypothetical protein
LTVAGIKISALPPELEVDPGDLLPVVSQAQGETRKAYAIPLSLTLVLYGTSAGAIAPSSPARGQLWVDTAPSPPVLKLWDGTVWEEISFPPDGVFTNPGASAPADAVLGTMWDDTATSPQQLLLYDGATWRKVDPTVLTEADADGRYIQIDAAAGTYISKASAAQLYLKKADAEDRYQSIAAAIATYLRTEDASSTYLVEAQADQRYLQITDAVQVYLSKYNAAITYESINDAAAAFLRRDQLVDNTGDTATDMALTANQGYQLQQQINAVKGGQLRLCGAYDASSSRLVLVTADGAARGFVEGQNLPPLTAGIDRCFVIVVREGRPAPPAPPGFWTGGDFLIASVADGRWVGIHYDDPQQVAQVVRFTPTADITATNVQAAIEQVDIRAQGTVTEFNVGTNIAGLRTTGGPVTSTGTVNVEGAFGFAGGGTDATTALEALSNLGGISGSTADSRYLQKSGGRLRGALTLQGDPVQRLQAATKRYVDAVDFGAGLEAGTTMLFAQRAAPIGWQQLTDPEYVDAAIRLVGGQGGDTVGTRGFTEVLTTGYTYNAPITIIDGILGYTTLDANQLAGHYHYDNIERYGYGGGYDACGPNSGNGGIYTSGSIGGGGSGPHTHGFNGQPSNAQYSGNFAVRYVDTIIARKV